MQTLEDDDAVIELLEDSGGVSEPSTNGRELVTRKMLKDERLCNMFGLSLNEKILKSFPCFLVAEILIQGTMLVTDRHICFYSNIPGLKRNIKIRFADIVKLTKEKVYAFFPTGIGVHTRQKERTVFSYVTSRDKLIQFLRNHWENYSEVDEDFCSSVRGSSIDDGQMDNGQPSSREASVLNDEDSGILVAPSVSNSVTAATAALTGLPSSTSADSTSVSGPSDDTASGGEESSTMGCDANPSAFAGQQASVATAGRHAQRPRSSSVWRTLLNDWDRLPNRHALTVIACLVLLCAIVIVYLSYRLNSLQQQLLMIISMRSGHGQSEVEHLNHRLGGIVETLGGLQEKLGNLRHLLHNLHPSGQNR